MRLYEPLTGSISLDGINIVSLDIVFLRSIIGYVQQEPVSWGSKSRVQALLLHFLAFHTSFVFRFCSRGALGITLSMGNRTQLKRHSPHAAIFLRMFG